MRNNCIFIKIYIKNNRTKTCLWWLITGCCTMDKTRLLHTVAGTVYRGEEWWKQWRKTPGLLSFQVTSGTTEDTLKGLHFTGCLGAHRDGEKPGWTAPWNYIQQKKSLKTNILKNNFFFLCATSPLTVAFSVRMSSLWCHRGVEESFQYVQRLSWSRSQHDLKIIFS